VVTAFGHEQTVPRGESAYRPRKHGTSPADTGRRVAPETPLDAQSLAEHAAAWVSAVEQVVAALAAAFGVAEVCEVVASAATTVFGATSSAVWLVDTAGVYSLVARPPVSGGRPASIGCGERPAMTLAAGEAVRVPLTAGQDRLGVLAPPARCGP
jgi:hypothetical protein